MIYNCLCKENHYNDYAQNIRRHSKQLNFPGHQAPGTCAGLPFKSHSHTQDWAATVLYLIVDFVNVRVVAGKSRTASRQSMSPTDRRLDRGCTVLWLRKSFSKRSMVARSQYGGGRLQDVPAFKKLTGHNSIYNSPPALYLVSAR